MSKITNQATGLSSVHPREAPQKRVKPNGEELPKGYVFQEDTVAVSPEPKSRKVRLSFHHGEISDEPVKISPKLSESVRHLIPVFLGDEPSPGFQVNRYIADANENQGGLVIRGCGAEAFLTIEDLKSIAFQGIIRCVTGFEKGKFFARPVVDPAVLARILADPVS